MRTSRGQLLLGDWPLFRGTAAELLDEVDRLVAVGEPAMVVTPNTAHVQLLETHRGLRDAYAVAALRLVDSAPIAWLSHAVNAPATRLPGADLLPMAASVAAERGWRVAILGGGPQVAERASERLRELHPGADIVGLNFPMTNRLPDPQDEVIVEALRDVKPDIVFVCLGAPKQELWIHHWLADLPSAVYIGAGAAVDFVAGNVKRAPSWIQSIGLEWLWRLAQEPSRLGGRYARAAAAYGRLVARSVRLSLSRRVRHAS